MSLSSQHYRSWKRTFKDVDLGNGYVARKSGLESHRRAPWALTQRSSAATGGALVATGFVAKTLREVRAEVASRLAEHTVYETAQWESLAGQTLTEVMQRWAGRDWTVAPVVTRTVKGSDAPPWGRSWFCIGRDGRLELFRYNWDSSG